MAIKDGFFVADCVEFMSRMDEGVVDLTVTSPPYDNLRDYKGYSFDFENIAKQLYKVTKPGGIVVWVVGDKIKKGRSLTSFRQGLFFQEIGFQMHDVMIYQKKNTPFMRSNAYTNCYEFMFVLSKGRPNTFNPLKVETARHGPEMLVYNKKPDGINKKTLKELKKEKTRTNIWSYAVGLGGTTSDRIAFKHPAVFPERLAEDHILSWTNVGDLVFDPMCGSGTTGKMALIHRRRFIGVDISEEYIAIAKERIENTKFEFIMKPDDFVIATRSINGVVMNSVGIINSICEKGVLVYFIGKNEVVIAPFDSISVIDISQTGDRHPNKICNVCHIRKPTTEFNRNQNQAGGRPIRRPSCQECRKKIDGERMPTSERRRMNARRPSDKAVFICPICEKRTIVNVTAKIVPDHDHDTGAGREWICDSCNTGLGRFKDDITILETAIKYLKRFENDKSEDSDSK